MPRPSEDELIARYFVPLAGPGGLGLRDDAAALIPPAGQELVLTTDMVVADVHFFADDPPDTIARKALRVNLSDLAAKGATPLGFLLSLGLPRDWTQDWLSAFAQALGEDAATYGCPLLGGDTVKSPAALIVSIVALGLVAQGEMVPRGGTQAGDLLYVSGTIGDAALGLKFLRGERDDLAWIAALDRKAQDFLVARYRVPEPRQALAPLLRRFAHAAMDISDGFAGDLAKMLGLAGMTSEIFTADVPLSDAARRALACEPTLIGDLLSGGDDYEILCALAPAKARAFEAEAKAAGIAVAAVGRARPGATQPTFRTPAGPLSLAALSYQHF